MALLNSRTFPMMVAMSLLCGCSSALFTQSKGALIAIATPKANPDDKEVPSVEVAGVNLVGEIVEPNSNSTTPARVEIIDESAAAVTHSAETGRHNQFKLPIREIHASTLPLRLKVNGRFFYADVVLPPDLAAAVNTLRLQADLEGFKESEVAKDSASYIDSRKLMLVLPANGHTAARTDENVLTGIPKQTVSAVSMPKVNTASQKALGVWTSVENQSTQAYVRFAWQKTFDATSNVRMVLAKNETDASMWDGQDVSVPVWTGRTLNDVVLTDFAQCTDPVLSGRPAAGVLSASSASACGLSSSAFPFTETDVFYVRLAAESSTELRLSAVFRLSKNNSAPVLSSFSVLYRINDGQTLSLPFTLSDTDTTLNCIASLTAHSSNQKLLPNGNISLTGTVPDCTVTLASVANQWGSASVTLTAADGQGGTATQMFALSRDWQPDRYLKAANAGGNDHFGAQVVLSGDRLAVSAPDEDSSQTTITNGSSASTSDAAPDSGAVYVYRSGGGVWSQEAYIKAANTSSTVNHFGTSIALSGNTLAVGAPGEDSLPVEPITNGSSQPLASATDGVNNLGAVYVYAHVNGAWQQQAFIRAFNSGSLDGFGSSVALDGDVLAVGAPGEDTQLSTITNAPSVSDAWTLADLAADTGAVYVYRRSNGLWSFDAYIKGSNLKPGDLFGDDVSLSGDTLAVGASGDDASSNTILSSISSAPSYSPTVANSGAVYIFRRLAIGGWVQEAYIKAVNLCPEDQFGTQLSLFGETLAVGVANEDSNLQTITNGPTASLNNSLSNSGAVYVYARLGTVWSQQAYIKAPQSSQDDKFGISVSLHGDSLAVGAVGEDSDLNTIVSGSGYTSNENQSAAGAVYIFRRSGLRWALDALVKARFVNTNDEFGNSVSLVGDALAVGAAKEDTPLDYDATTPSAINGLFDSGAVHIFKR